MKPTLKLLLKEHRASEILEAMAQIYEERAQEAKRWKSRIVAPLCKKIAARLWAAANTLDTLSLIS